MRDAMRASTVPSPRAVLAPCGALVATALLLHVTGIGCPIKFATGISCPGCGMTRAWLATLSLRLDLALAYHPLFWTAPMVVALVASRSRMAKRAYTTCATCLILAFVGVWVARLALPHEANVLFSGLLTKDIVSIDTPRWLTALHSTILP